MLEPKWIVIVALTSSVLCAGCVGTPETGAESQALSIVGGGATRPPSGPPPARWPDLYAQLGLGASCLSSAQLTSLENQLRAQFTAASSFVDVEAICYRRSDGHLEERVGVWLEPSSGQLAFLDGLPKLDGTGGTFLLNLGKALLQNQATAAFWGAPRDYGRLHLDDVTVTFGPSAQVDTIVSLHVDALWPLDAIRGSVDVTDTLGTDGAGRLTCSSTHVVNGEGIDGGLLAPAVNAVLGLGWIRLPASAAKGGVGCQVASALNGGLASGMGASILFESAATDWLQGITVGGVALP